MITPVVPDSSHFSSAKTQSPDHPKQLALKALAGGRPTQIATEHNVSRKFVYRQAKISAGAIDAAFTPTQKKDDDVLFYLPVTKSLIRQIVLTLMLRCH